MREEADEASAPIYVINANAHAMLKTAAKTMQQSLYLIAIRNGATNFKVMCCTAQALSHKCHSEECNLEQKLLRRTRL